MNPGKKKDPSEKDIKLILNLFNTNNFVDAKKEVDEQIINFPNSSILYNILGAIFVEQNQLDKGIESYKKSIEINSKYAEVYNNLGAALYKLEKINESIENFNKAISLKSDFPQAINNLGNAMLNLNRPKDSLEYFKKSLRLKPDYAEAFYNIGLASERLGENEEALDNFFKAIKINPNFAEAYNHIGLLFFKNNEYQKSLIYFKKTIELNSKYEKAYNNIGNTLNELGEYDQATNAYKQAIKIKPDYSIAYSNLLFNLNYKTNFNPEEYLSVAKNFRIYCGPTEKKLSIKFQYEKKPEKLKIGFVSADFGNHPGGYFTLSTLRELKKKNLELVAYSTFDRSDDFSRYFRPLFLKWNSIEKKKDQEVISQIVSDGIHILFDLQGHSARNRLPIFFHKPAPIQASWLGQGSSGIKEIDYFIGSSHITPENEEKNYIEKILRLPEISQVFTPPDFSIKIGNLPAIKNNFITFGSLNKISKTSKETIILWSKILLSIKNSKLLLKSRELSDLKFYKEVIEKFKKLNIDENRLILKGMSKTRKETLEYYNQIDICLDPFPFQGNTTTCESVWMGVPVITLKGDRYLFHFGESINSNLNMTEWIAKNSDEYIFKAIKFSSNLNELSKIRSTLRARALRSPVFNEINFAKHFDKMLWGMWKNFNKTIK